MWINLTNRPHPVLDQAVVGDWSLKYRTNECWLTRSILVVNVGIARLGLFVLTELSSLCEFECKWLFIKQMTSMCDPSHNQLLLRLASAPPGGKTMGQRMNEYTNKETK